MLLIVSRISKFYRNNVTFFFFYLFRKPHTNFTCLLLNLLYLGTSSPFWKQTNLCYSSSYQIENLNNGHMNKIPQWQSVTVQPEQVYHCYLCTWWQWKCGILNCLVLSSWQLLCLCVCVFFCLPEINCPCVAGWQQCLWEGRPEKWGVSISCTHSLLHYTFYFPPHLHIFFSVYRSFFKWLQQRFFIDT